MTVQIITSSTMPSQRLINAFNNGLADAGRPGYKLEPIVHLDGKYDDGGGKSGYHHELYDAMKTADAGSVEVIVAAGGLVSAHAANDQIKKTPFLILVGQHPLFDLDTPKYCGGVNLDMVRQNTARHGFLVNHYQVDPTRICLIWNGNSKMGRLEMREWDRHDWPDVQAGGENSDDAITTAFKMAKTMADAVVVSGDPYFTGRMNTVVQAATDQTLKVCYPFSGYAYATPAPAPKVSMLYGPDLEFAYRLLGRKAAILLNNQKNPPQTGLDRCPTAAPIFLGD